MTRSFFLFLVLILTPLLARGDQAGLAPYKEVSADGKYLFVMLDSRDKPGREVFPANGLYLNNGSRVPLWTVDWIGNAYLPSDGIHLVRFGSWPSTGSDYNDEALTFLAYGKPLKSYTVRELVDFPFLLPHTASHYTWTDSFHKYSGAGRVPLMYVNNGEAYSSRSATFDESTHTLLVKTHQGDSIVFDLNTGEILNSYHPVRKWLSIFLVLGFLAYGLYVVRSSSKPQLDAGPTSLRIAVFASLLSILVVFVVMMLQWRISTSTEIHSMPVTEALKRFLWYWPVRYLRSRDSQTMFYPLPEFQTYTLWLMIFIFLGTANTAVVRIVKRVREGTSG